MVFFKIIHIVHQSVVEITLVYFYIKKIFCPSTLMIYA